MSGHTIRGRPSRILFLAANGLIAVSPRNPGFNGSLRACHLGQGLSAYIRANQERRNDGDSPNHFEVSLHTNEQFDAIEEDKLILA
jgi:hypothetical protein